MLILKPLSIDWSVAGARNPRQSLSLRKQVLHPGTRTYVRLLGPCFKTGRVKPFCHHLRVKERSPTRRAAAKLSFPRLRAREEGVATGHEVFNPKMSSTRHVRSPVGKLPCPLSFPQLQIDVDRQGKKHHTRPFQSQLQHLR